MADAAAPETEADGAQDRRPGLPAPVWASLVIVFIVAVLIIFGGGSITP